MYVRGHHNMVMDSRFELTVVVTIIWEWLVLSAILVILLIYTYPSRCIPSYKSSYNLYPTHALWVQPIPSA